MRQESPITTVKFTGWNAGQILTMNEHLLTPYPRFHDAILDLHVIRCLKSYKFYIKCLQKFKTERYSVHTLCKVCCQFWKTAIATWLFYLRNRTKLQHKHSYMIPRDLVHTDSDGVSVANLFPLLQALALVSAVSSWQLKHYPNTLPVSTKRYRWKQRKFFTPAPYAFGANVYMQFKQSNS